MRDALGTETSVRAYASVNPAATVLQLYDMWHNWCVLLDLISDAKIISGKVSIPEPWTIFDGKGDPLAGGRVEQVGLFTYSVVGTNKHYTTSVPAIGNGALIGDRIDLGDSSIISFTTLWENDEAVYIFSNENFQAINGFLEASIAFHKLRKQLQRSSRVR